MFVELITAKLPWCFNENIESFNYAIYKVHLSQVGRERMTKRAVREGRGRGRGQRLEGEGRGREEGEGRGERKGGRGEEGRGRREEGRERREEGRERREEGRERMETEGSYHLSSGWLLR